MNNQQTKLGCDQRRQAPRKLCQVRAPHDVLPEARRETNGECEERKLTLPSHRGKGSCAAHPHLVAHWRVAVLPYLVSRGQIPSLSAKSWKFLPTTSNDPAGSISSVPVPPSPGRYREPCDSQHRARYRHHHNSARHQSPRRRSRARSVSMRAVAAARRIRRPRWRSLCSGQRGAPDTSRGLMSGRPKSRTSSRRFWHLCPVAVRQPQYLRAPNLREPPYRRAEEFEPQHPVQHVDRRPADEQNCPH
jgi:hypothetical protein